MANLNQSKTVSGYFSVPPSSNLFGQLCLAHTKSYLHLLSNKALDPVEKISQSVIYGLLDNGDHVTLLDCTFSGTSYHIGLSGEMHKYIIYPRIILSGNSHYNPDNCRIRQVCFELEDAMRIFHSSTRIGTIWDRHDLMELISGDRRLLDVSSESFGWVSYFIGPVEFLRCDTQLGTISVNAATRYEANLTLFVGQSVKVKTVIENEHGGNIYDSIYAMKIFSQLLGIIVGKQQDLSNIEFVIESERTPYDARLNAYFTTPILHPNVSDSGQREVHPDCFLIDPVQKREELSVIVDKWFEKAKARTLARARVLSEWGSTQYNTDRLVRVANAFDLLDGKSGGRGLANRIISRSKLIMEFLPNNVQNDLIKVIEMAVECRNYFVHGPRRGKQRVGYENGVIFYSDTLEFVFLASDLVDCGWDMRSWMTQRLRGWHPFLNYMDTFDERYKTCA